MSCHQCAAVVVCASLIAALFASLPAAASAQAEAPAAAGGTLVLLELGALLVEASAFDGHSDFGGLAVVYGILQLIGGTVLLALVDVHESDAWMALGAVLLVQGTWHGIGFPITMFTTRSDRDPTATSALRPSVSVTSHGATLALGGAF